MIHQIPNLYKTARAPLRDPWNSSRLGPQQAGRRTAVGRAHPLSHFRDGKNANKVTRTAWICLQLLEQRSVMKFRDHSCALQRRARLHIGWHCPPKRSGEPFNLEHLGRPMVSTRPHTTASGAPDSTKATSDSASNAAGGATRVKTIVYTGVASAFGFSFSPWDVVLATKKIHAGQTQLILHTEGRLKVRRPSFWYFTRYPRRQILPAKPNNQYLSQSSAKRIEIG